MSDISKINPNGTEYNLKDATARAGIESSKTLKSSVVTVTDAAPINAEDITVDITPVQDLHGYDSPWAGGAGKNKLEVTLSSGIHSGVQWAVDSQGRINISGTVPAGGVTLNTAIADVDTTVLVGYKFIAETSGSGNVYPRIMNNNLTSNLQDLSNGAIIKDNGSNCKLALRLENNSSYSKNISLMIIPHTETDATFAPYSNICPIEGRTGAELDRVGKNWFDIDNYTLDSAGVSVEDNKVIFVNNNYVAARFPVQVIEGQTYTFSFDLSLTSGSAFVGGTAGSVGRFTERYSSSGTYTIQYTAVHTEVISIAMCGASSTSSGEFSNIQLELGTQPTAYEPYQGKQYTVSFSSAGTVYSGMLDVTTGSLVVDKVLKTYNTSTMGNDSDDYPGWRFYPSGEIRSIVGASLNHIYTDEHCNIGTSFLVNTQYSFDILALPFTEYGKTEAEWIALAMDVQVTLPLATPQTYQLSPTQIQMLQGINTVYADCGDVSLKYQPDNVIGELKGEIEDSIIYEDYKWTTESSRTYSAGTPGTYGCSSWRDVKKEGYDVIGVTFVENRRFGDCILTLYYIPSTSHVEVIIFRATSSSVTIADEDITYRVAYKKH